MLGSRDGERFTLEMKAIRSSETLVTTYKTTQRHNPEDYN
jgi:hypothetical protein